jgi:hypothetical protein
MSASEPRIDHPSTRRCHACRYYRAGLSDTRHCSNPDSPHYRKTNPPNRTCGLWRQYKPGRSAAAQDAEEEE